MYIVIRTRFLTGITRESYWYRETLQNPSAFYILNFYKPNPFYPFKQLITLSFENTSSLRIDNPLHNVLQAPFIIAWHQFLEPLPGGFSLFKRQFHGTRLPVDHSIGNFVPFSLNSVFLLFIFFYLFILLL